MYYTHQLAFAATALATSTNLKTESGIKVDTTRYLPRIKGTRFVKFLYG
jgi:hypothetical protein